ncbi:hypothetical protein ACFLVF_01785 [Chloroflexota bacterium]
MSFVITVFVPEGIVLASDSRQSITVKRLPEAAKQQSVETVNSDFVYKVFLLPKRGVGISTFGEFAMGKITVESHLKRFQEEIIRDGDGINNVAQKLLEYFRDINSGADTTFHVAGFMKESGLSVPYVYNCHVSRNELKRLNTKPGKDEITYGVSWGGQGDVIAGILGPPRPLNRDDGIQRFVKAPVIWNAMTIQDAIDFAIYAVRTTIDTIRFQARQKNVGGAIDVLLITPEEASWIQRKKYRGQI